MTVAIPCYCTREDVAEALDVKATARASKQIDRQIQAATISVEGLLHRKFWVYTGVRRFDWPNLSSGNSAYPWRIWLDQHEALTVTSFVSGGVTIPAAGYLLEPVNDPPYSHVDLNLGSAYAFSSATTWQQSQVLTGTWSGAPATTTPAGALAAAITLTTATTVDVTDSSAVGVGSTLIVDSERMLVTGRSMLSTGQTLQAPGLTASDANVTAAVTDGTLYAVGETILIDSERMLVVDIAGNNLTVKRGWSGSVLAIHTAGATIYAPRRLTVVRGSAGTTAATHLISAAASVEAYPALVSTLAVAEAVNLLLSEQSGWARTVGSGDAIRNASGRGLQDLRDQTYAAHGRQMRMRSI